MPKGKPLNTTARHFVAAREGDPEALSELFKRIHQRLYRFSLYLTGNAALANDLCQDAYVKAIRHIKSLQLEPEFFVPWLFRVTRNQFLDYVRSPKNRPGRSPDDLSPALLGVMGDSEAVTRIKQGLGQLSTEDRYLFLLVFLEGTSYAEAARITGLPETTIRNRLHRIRKSFRSLFYTQTHTNQSEIE